MTDDEGKTDHTPKAARKRIAEDVEGIRERERRDRKMTEDALVEMAEEFAHDVREQAEPHEPAGGDADSGGP